MSETLDVKVTYVRLNQGDRILACSDGLYNMVPTAEPRSSPATAHGSHCCKVLIDRRNANGGAQQHDRQSQRIFLPGTPSRPCCGSRRVQAFPRRRL